MMFNYFENYWQNLLLVASVFAVGVVSPGPATLMILNSAVSRGRAQALALSTGLIIGSIIWALIAAIGFAAAISTSATFFLVMKLIASFYLFYLAIKSFRSSMTQFVLKQGELLSAKSLWRQVMVGLLIQLTNPKTALIWVLAFSLGADAALQPQFYPTVIVLCVGMAVMIYAGYALLFSSTKVSNAYSKMKRQFDLVVGTLFASASIVMLSSAA